MELGHRRQTIFTIFAKPTQKWMLAANPPESQNYSAATLDEN
jgi:hypothetical protein